MTMVQVANPSGLDARSARWASLIIGLLMILVFAGPMLSLSALKGTGDGSPIRQLFYLGALGLAISASRPDKDPRRLLVIPPSLVVALAWCLISLTWSEAASIGLRRLILTFTVIWSVFLIVRNAGFDRSVQVIQVTFVGCLVLNYAAVALLPSGVHSVNEVADPNLIGNWRGILAHKNFAGSITAMTILFIGLGPSKMKPVLRIAILLAAGFFLYKTHSKTSGAFAIGCLLLGWLFKYYDPRYRSLILPGLVIVVTLLVILLQNHIGELLAPFARPDALTGRVQIWPVLLNYASTHPWTGAGYGSFWNSGPDAPIFDYSQNWVNGLGNGHNGYLDLLVQVGIPGLVLIVMATMILPIGKLFASRAIQPGRGGLLLAMILFCMGHNITETSMFERDTIMQLFLMMAVALTEVATRDEVVRPQRRSSAPEDPQSSLG